MKKNKKWQGKFSKETKEGRKDGREIKKKKRMKVKECVTSINTENERQRNEVQEIKLNIEKVKIWR